MFKHLLLPTDGSKFSDRPVHRGIEFAQWIGARITTVHVIPEFRMMADESFALPTSADIKRRYEREAKARAEKMLAKIGKKAKAADVTYDAMTVSGDVPSSMRRSQRCEPRNPAPPVMRARGI